MLPVQKVLSPQSIDQVQHSIITQKNRSRRSLSQSSFGFKVQEKEHTHEEHLYQQSVRPSSTDADSLWSVTKNIFYPHIAINYKINESLRMDACLHRDKSCTGIYKYNSEGVSFRKHKMCNNDMKHHQCLYLFFLHDLMSRWVRFQYTPQNPHNTTASMELFSVMTHVTGTASVNAFFCRLVLLKIQTLCNKTCVQSK